MGSVTIGRYNVLNSKQVKEIKKALKKQWGIENLELPILKKETNLFLLTRDVDGFPIDELRINSAGLYLGEFRHKEMRLSIEGSQLLGSQATRNVVEINDEEAHKWIRGGTLEREGEKAFVIVKHNNDFLGCGRRKEGTVLNFVPKSRRLSN